MDGYVGVKFDAVRLDDALPSSCDGLFERFKACGDRLASYGMAPANGGNLSERTGATLADGLAITCSGCNLGLIDPDEISWVESCSLEHEQVRFAAPHRPSSEAMMHWLIYRDFPAARAIVHAHDEAATTDAALARIATSHHEEPYGTVGLARAATDTFARGDDIIVLRNHGYVARGETLEEAAERVVRMHLELR